MHGRARRLVGLPARFTLPPMPMQERVQLARALAEKHGRRLTDVEDWRPLLLFTRGNPLTITMVVGQALGDGLRTREGIEEFVAKLRAGQAVIEDEESEARERSLAASLGYAIQFGAESVRPGFRPALQIARHGWAVGSETGIALAGMQSQRKAFRPKAGEEKRRQRRHTRQIRAYHKTFIVGP